jgi:hypothetical protein
VSSIRAWNLIDPFSTFPFHVFVRKNNTGPCRLLMSSASGPYQCTLT